MTNIRALAGASVGHVRACFSGRCRGFAAPVDLMRAHLRAVNRCAVRRRVASAFAGYLVTDAGPDVLPLFSGRRGDHAPGCDPDCMTGSGPFLRGDFGRVFDFAIDAPGVIAAGSVRAGEWGASSSVAQRWREEWRDGLTLPAAPRVEEKKVETLAIWRDYSGRVVCINAAVCVHGLRGDFEGCERDSLDAPDYLAAGSVLRHESGGEVWAKDRRVFRAGWWE